MYIQNINFIRKLICKLCRSRCQVHSLDEQRSSATLSPLGGRPKRHFDEYEQTEDFFNLILQVVTTNQTTFYL